MRSVVQYVLYKASAQRFTYNIGELVKIEPKGFNEIPRAIDALRRSTSYNISVLRKATIFYFSRTCPAKFNNFITSRDVVTAR